MMAKVEDYYPSEDIKEQLKDIDTDELVKIVAGRVPHGVFAYVKDDKTWFGIGRGNPQSMGVILNNWGSSTNLQMHMEIVNIMMI